MGIEQEAIAAGPTDNELMEGAFAEQSPEPVPQKPEPSEDGRGNLHGEGGRFVSKTRVDDEEVQPQRQEPAESAGEPETHRVPLGEYMTEREKRQAAERRAEEAERRWAAYQAHLRQQREAAEAPQPPDPIADPQGYDQFLRDQVDTGAKSARQAAREDFVNLTFDLAVDQHGEEAVDAAMKALEASGDKHAANQIAAAKNPAKALMKWHREHQTRAEVGDDLEGFLKRKQDEWAKDPEVRKRILADLEAEARGGANGNRSTVISIPSVNRATGGGRSSNGQQTAPVTDRDFFNDATAGLGRR